MVLKSQNRRVGIIAGVVRIVTKKSLPNTTSGMNIATLVRCYDALALMPSPRSTLASPDSPCISVWSATSSCASALLVNLSSRRLLTDLFSSPFARHYVRWSSNKVELQKSQLYNSVSYLAIMKRIWPEAVNVFLAFFITLTLFPGTLLLIPSRNGINAAWFGIFLIVSRTPPAFLPFALLTAVSLFFCLTAHVHLPGV